MPNASPPAGTPDVLGPDAMLLGACQEHLAKAEAEYKRLCDSPYEEDATLRVFTWRAIVRALRERDALCALLLDLHVKRLIHGPMVDVDDLLHHARQRLTAIREGT